MYKKNLWRSVIAGTLALAMTLTPVGTAYANATVPTEATTEMTVTTATEADASTESTTEETTETDSNTEDATEATTTEDTSTEESTERSSTETATNTENTTEDSEWPVYVLDADEDTTELDADMAGEIPVTAKYFPDDTFREYVSENIDQDKNGVLSQTERDACTEIEIGYEIVQEVPGSCKDLTGIQYFQNLNRLDFSYHRVKKVDVSKNSKLTVLLCLGNQLTSIDVTHNPELTTLDCDSNQIKSFDLSKNKKLSYFSCQDNELTTLDVSKNVNLTELMCSTNKLTNLNLKNNTKLIQLSCATNLLTELNLDYNSQIQNIVCQNNSIENISIRHCPQLRGLYCYNNHLSSLDISKNLLLSSLNCSNNFLTSLDISSNKNLCGLECTNNQLACIGWKTWKFNSSYGPNLKVDGNSYPVTLNSKRQVDLNKIPYFQVDRMSNLTGGTLSGSTLTFNKGVKTVSYSYKLGDVSYSFSLTVKKEKPLTPTEAFCSRLYTLCLGRTADPSGITYWAGRLNGRSLSGAQVGYNFVFSDEYKKKKTSNEDFVKMLYLVFMDRSADKAGLNYWVDLLNQGVSREYVYKGFAESNEFQKICYSYDIMPGTISLKQARDQNINLTKFVSRIYAKAMNRKGDEAGLNYWCRQIQNKKMTPTQVAESFIYSKEFTDKKLSNTEYVKVLYRTFMGREADKSGLNYWVGRLNRGESRKTILKSFAGCPEFQKIVKSFGL